VIAYFIAGLFAYNFIHYKELYATKELSLLMRPVTTPIVALGPVLQLIRGMILALVLLPFRKVIVEEKHGYLKLALLIVGLSVISTIGPAPGSFDGYIYTIIPAGYQMLGYIEAALYVFLFVSILAGSYKLEKAWVNTVAIVLLILITLAGIAGYVSLRN